MQEKITFSFLGGDIRQKECASIIESEGHKVKTFGIDNISGKDITVYDKLNETFFNCDVLMLPIPYKNKKGFISIMDEKHSLALNDIETYLKSDIKVILGKADNEFQKYVDKYGFEYFDLLQDEAFAILNAIPSAEGAIQLAMEYSDITLHGSNVLVLGFGRLGKTLARMLKGIGANVTVEARKSKDLAWIVENGYNGIYLSNLNNILSEQDFIFNTIPFLILDRNRLKQINTQTVIIDLASYPGGVDFEAARELGIKAKLELGLPGIVAPKSAARIIWKITKEVLKI